MNATKNKSVYVEIRRLKLEMVENMLLIVLLFSFQEYFMLSKTLDTGAN